MKMFMSISDKIKEVEVERVTEHFAWIGDRRYALTSDYTAFHETWQKAKDHIVAQAQSDVDVHQRRLDYYTRKLGCAKAMTPPAGQEREGCAE